MDSFDNRATLKAMSDAAKAGVPGMETHPDYVRRYRCNGCGSPQEGTHHAGCPLATERRITDADREAYARRAQGEAMERAFPGCGPVDGSDL